MGTNDLNWRQAADLHLLLSVGKCLLGKSEGLFLHADVFVGEYQVPIDVLNLIQRIDDLQAESDIGEFAVVFRDADEASVGGETESLQQMLRQLEPEIGVELWT